MKAMEKKILEEGKVLPGGILKVGSFLNQQIDTSFLGEMAKEFARLYADAGVNKVLTIESSGIAIAAAVALEMAGQCLASIRRRRLEEQIAALRQALSTAQGAQRRELLERLNGLLAELDRF